MSLPRVLIVEDTPINRDLLAQWLEDEYALEFACDGLEALEQLKSNAYDLVLLDISIPKLDGEEVLRRARTELGLTELPFIAVTAHAMEGDRERLLASGCDMYISKPIKMPELFAAMEKLLGASDA